MAWACVKIVYDHFPTRTAVEHRARIAEERAGAEAGRHAAG